MTKYRLKKDTPDHRAGELFVLMSNNGIYEIDAGEDDPLVFYGGDIKSFDEWFEEVQENNPLFEDLTHDDQRDEVAVEIWFRKDKDGGHPKEMVDFTQFMRAVNVVSQDEGFMTRQPNGIGWAICLRADGQLDVASVYNEFAGVFCFALIDDAKASIKNHPDEWKTIEKYKWGKE